MYDNIGKTLQRIAFGLLLIVTVGGAILFVSGLFEYLVNTEILKTLVSVSKEKVFYGIVKMLISVILFITGFIGSMLIEGFGQLIESTKSIEKMLKDKTRQDNQQ